MKQKQGPLEYTIKEKARFPCDYVDLGIMVWVPIKILPWLDCAAYRRRVGREAYLQKRLIEIIERDHENDLMETGGTL